MMHEVVYFREPTLLERGDWHIPFSTCGLNHQENIEKSVACTAFVSYDTIENQREPEKYKRMYDNLEAMEHWSCFQHIHQCQGDDYMYEACQGFISLRELKKANKRDVKYNDSGVCTIEEYLTDTSDIDMNKLTERVLYEYKLRDIEVDRDSDGVNIFKRNLLDIAFRSIKC